MLADTIVKRWQDHLPMHRLDDVYARYGIELARSTMRGWHGALAELAKPLGKCDARGCSDAPAPVHRCDGSARSTEGALTHLEASDAPRYLVAQTRCETKSEDLACMVLFETRKGPNSISSPNDLGECLSGQTTQLVFEYALGHLFSELRHCWISKNGLHLELHAKR
jgi:hypothetical protein